MLRRQLTAGAASAAAWRGALSALRTQVSWAHVPEAPKDPILGVSERYIACTDPDKMNLGVGAYRDDDGKPVVLDCVREAERRIAGNKNMEYLPIAGLKDFCNLSVKLVYGDDSSYVKNGQVASIQTLSGTGAVRVMADFQHRFAPNATIYISVPTWVNHHNIYRDAHVPQKTYRYYHPPTRSLDLDGMLEDMRAAPNGSFFLLHACAHNPTGVDPTPDQWRQISAVMKEKGHFPFFDSAYQGFASGDFVRDARAISLFVEDGHKVAVSQSYAKNMGLYGQRVGCLSVLCASAAEARAVESQLKLIARPMYSNPPMHGAVLAATILGDPALRAQWFREVKTMADRIILMRKLLRDALETGGTGPWKHVTHQIGMFTFTGLAPEQARAAGRQRRSHTAQNVDKLELEHHIFMTRNGRISMAGVTSKTVDRLAKAINKVMKQ